jgi:hypothetical protein
LTLTPSQVEQSIPATSVTHDRGRPWLGRVDAIDMPDPKETGLNQMPGRPHQQWELVDSILAS